MFKTSSQLVKHTVLVVEDNIHLRRLLYNILKSSYHVRTAANGLEALAAIKEKMPDLVLTDILMPYLDGLELIRNMKKSGLYKHIPVFVISGCNLSEVTEMLEGEGVSEIFQKPFNPESLKEKIDNAIAAYYA